MTSEMGQAPTLMERGADIVAREKRYLPLYFVIGASAAIVDLVLFSLGHHFVGLSEVAANVVSVHIATVWSFCLNRAFNFRVTSHPVRRLVCFYFVALVGLSAGTTIIYVFAVRLGLQPDLVKLASLPVVFVLQYCLNRALTFSTLLTTD